MSQPHITKVYHYCAAHRYYNADWNEEKNKDVFGKDSNNHGHNYALHVTVKGEIDPGTGWVVDLGEMNVIVKQHVLDVFDHAQIEEDIEWFSDKQPSSENMVKYMWQEISKHLTDAELVRIRLVETPTIYTDYYG